MSERTTADPVPEEQLRGDVDQVMEAIGKGGVAIVPLDVAYAIIAATPEGIRTIFDVKNRSYDKPSGMFASWEMSAEIHILEEEKRRMIREVVEQERIPFSVVAPFSGDHPVLQAADPFVLDASSKAGTLDMLLNAGPFHDEIARQSVERNLPVFGSSANTSLTGSKYRLADVDAPVREAADVAFDYGRSVYANAHGLSSTIIDFRDFSVVRRGVVFDKLEAAFLDRYGVELSV